MWRSTVCAVSGLALLFGTAYGLSSIYKRSTEANFDLRWMAQATKGDRLSSVQVQPSDDVVMAFNVASEKTTIAAKGTVAGRVNYSAVEVSRDRTPAVGPVRTVPNDDMKQSEKARERLPVGCEPAFSPVTVPSLAHIGSRCDA